MPITLNTPHDDGLGEKLTAIGARQAIPVPKTVLARAILDQAIAACERTGDPAAWQRLELKRESGRAEDREHDDSSGNDSTISTGGE